MSLNWDYNINDKMKLSSVVYGSWGRGGATNGAGAIRGNRFFADPLKTANGLINVDLIRNYNSGMPVVINNVSYTRAKINGLYESSNSTSSNSTNGISQIASVNSHNWYGAVVNLNTKLTDNLVLDFGVDARTYRGIHYQTLIDLLGSDIYNANYSATGATNNDVNNKIRSITQTSNARPHGNPFFNSDHQNKINYNTSR